MSDMQDTVRLQADVEWCYSVFEHMDIVVKDMQKAPNDIKPQDIDTLAFLIKQGMKVKREQ